MVWVKRFSIKVFWVGCAIALLALLALSSQIASPEKYVAIQIYVGGFVMGYITYAIATKFYK
jgi:hypothetical protein